MPQKTPKKLTKKELQKKERKAQKKAFKMADENWKRAIRARDQFTCQVCLKVLEERRCMTHHIIPRHFKQFRHELWNGIALCYFCHKVGIRAAHQNAIWFALWLKNHKPEQYFRVVEALELTG